VALGVGEDGSLLDVHFARKFAEANSGYVRGLDLLAGFVRDLSAHGIIVLTLGRLYNQIFRQRSLQALRLTALCD
jgi:hypothetical protein